MKVLIAEDDPFFRTILRKLLGAEYEVCESIDGSAAWSLLRQSKEAGIVILDWVMPGLSGPQLCRLIRNNPLAVFYHVILLTSKNNSADIVAGLAAGADDYVTKPFEAEELRARVRLGRRIVELQTDLGDTSENLKEALAREQLLQASLNTFQRGQRSLNASQLVP
jgi:phosphoserine phosphatase RsbU/P